jgi:hypothetical protein
MAVCWQLIHYTQLLSTGEPVAGEGVDGPKTADSKPPEMHILGIYD